MTTIFNLPTDCILVILSFLNGKSIARFSSVCQLWKPLCAREELWEIIVKSSFRANCLIPKDSPLSWKNFYFSTRGFPTHLELASSPRGEIQVIDPFTVVNKKGGNINVVYTNKPLPYRGRFIYFEVIFLENPSPNGGLSVGFVTSYPPPAGRHIGWDHKSWGYHSDDGQMYHENSWGGKEFGPSYKEGDVIGCGFLIQGNRIFFTLNGQFIGFANKPHYVHWKNPYQLYPAVGLHFQKEKITLNLAQVKFLWQGNFPS
eukprot:TRINITY_DN5540_c0_g1_i1.p1 TRINITY_DN5540_c0_g1~~TRINITY_DN5540_c0_g1_i1.p1  ORF type:complete len:259 (-),score=22.66 TRINITY_DN5540_c0_g1_i1:74-850(-)